MSDENKPQGLAYWVDDPLQRYQPIERFDFSADGEIPSQLPKEERFGNRPQRVYWTRQQFDLYYKCLGVPADELDKGWVRMLEGKQPFSEE